MNEEKDPIIRLVGLWKSFNGESVLRGLNLDVYRGQTTVVIGPSGCGKTVLLRHIVGLLKPDKGKVFFDGIDITHLSERELVPIRRRIGFLFQSNALFDSMTVAENIYFPMMEQGIESEQELRRRCQEVLKLVGMEGMEHKMPEELSGGQKKRVALARAIALNPEVILYDEPTTGLDPVRADLINTLIIKLQKELKTTTLVVTHDMDSARKVADRIVMLYNGQILVDTTPEGLGKITNDVAIRFIDGQATSEELDEVRLGKSLREKENDRKGT